MPGGPGNLTPGPRTTGYLEFDIAGSEGAVGKDQVTWHLVGGLPY